MAIAQQTELDPEIAKTIEEEARLYMTDMMLDEAKAIIELLARLGGRTSQLRIDLEAHRQNGMGIGE